MSWFPDAIRDPGRNAGYRVGRTKNQCAVLHFTVGRDSRALIRDKGLAAFLFPKNGRPFQFCEADSITSHACEWNDEGPGLEFERMSWDEPLTLDQVRYGGAVIRWLAKTYGYPLTYYGDLRLPLGYPFRGFVNHGSLVHRACDQHTDGVTRGEWDAMLRATAPKSPTQKRKKVPKMVVLVDPAAPHKNRLVGETKVLIADLGDGQGKPYGLTEATIQAKNQGIPVIAGVPAK